jgi:hypothetical protein
VNLITRQPYAHRTAREIPHDLAEGLGAIVHPAVPLTALGVVAAAALACVILIAGLPARRAAVVGSDALRTE